MGGGGRGGEGKRVESPARDVGPDLQLERGGVGQLLAGLVVVDGAEQAGEGDWDDGGLDGRSRGDGGLGGRGLGGRGRKNRGRDGALGGRGSDVGVDIHGVSVGSGRPIVGGSLADGKSELDLYGLLRKVIVAVVDCLAHLNVLVIIVIIVVLVILVVSRVAVAVRHAVALVVVGEDVSFDDGRVVLPPVRERRRGGEDRRRQTDA